MRSSSLCLLALVLVTGCTRAVATPPIPPATAASPESSRARGGANRDAPAPAASTALSGALDPSEEITAEELASIPDPVPQPDPDPVPQPIPDAPVKAAESAERKMAEDGRRWVWRVQVFASPDLAQADRIAKEAGARFGEHSVIEYEGSLYKVRLGAFASESLAQALRERAVQEGYPGAFRMKSEQRTSEATK